MNPTKGQLNFLDQHLGDGETDWGSFTRRLRSKSFVKGVVEDPRSDETMRRYARAMNSLDQGQVVAKVPSMTGSAGRYRIKQMPTGRLGCTCNDWKYNRSVNGGDCKHVKAFKAMQKTAGVDWDERLREGKESLDQYKTVALKGQKYLLDKGVPVLRKLPADAQKAEEKLRSAIQGTGEQTWTHRQIAIPASVDLLKRVPGFERSRVTQVRLPGEPRRSGSWRYGTLHAHRYGPVWLVHEDASAPQGRGIVNAIKHLPEAMSSTLKRNWAPRPLISTEKIRRWQALEKTAEAVDTDRKLAEVVGDAALVPVEIIAVGTTASLPLAVMAHKSESPAQLTQYIKAVAKESGVPLSSVEIGKPQGRLNLLFDALTGKNFSRGGIDTKGRGALRTVPNAAEALHELGHVKHFQKGTAFHGPTNPNILDRAAHKALGGMYPKDVYPISKPWVRMGKEVAADAYMFEQLMRTRGTGAAVRGVLRMSPGLFAHAATAALPAAVMLSPLMVAAAKKRADSAEVQAVVKELELKDDS